MAGVSVVNSSSVIVVADDSQPLSQPAAEAAFTYRFGSFGRPVEASSLGEHLEQCTCDIGARRDPRGFYADRGHPFPPTTS